MTIQEALNEIRSEPRWYYQMRDGELIPETTLIVTAQRIENGRCKPDTIKRFFETFGYEVEINERVIKI